MFGGKTAHLQFIFRMTIPVPWRNVIIILVFLEISICSGDQSDIIIGRKIPVLYFIFSLMLYIKKKICYHEISLSPQSITLRKDIPELSQRMKKFHTFGLRSLWIWLELKCKYLHNEQIEKNIKMTALLRSILLSKFLNKVAKKIQIVKKKIKIQKSICKMEHEK